MLELFRQWVFVFHFNENDWLFRGHRGHDRVVVGYTTTYAISAYHHWCCGFKSRSGQGIQHYVIKFVSDFRHVCFSLGASVSFTNKTDCHDITEILLKVALNTIKQTNNLLFINIFDWVWRKVKRDSHLYVQQMPTLLHLFKILSRYISIKNGRIRT